METTLAQGCRNSSTSVLEPCAIRPVLVPNQQTLYGSSLIVQTLDWDY